MASKQALILLPRVLSRHLVSHDAHIDHPLLRSFSSERRSASIYAGKSSGETISRKVVEMARSAVVP